MSKVGILQKLNGIYKKYFPPIKNSPFGASEYDIIIIGSNSGAALSRQFYQFTKGEKTILGCYENSIMELKPLQQLNDFGILSRFKLIKDSKALFDNKIAHSEGNQVIEIMPKENKVRLSNDKIVNYKALVLANGLIGDYNLVEGLEDALKDPKCPAHCMDYFNDSPTKNYEFYQCWNQGNGYFYIPEFPIQGEGENYNFLLMLDIMKHYQNIGKMSTLSKFTIINANDSFYNNNEKLDNFIKGELEKYNIEILYNTKLSKVDKNNNILTIEKNGKTEQRDFGNFYSMKPVKENKLLIDSGLLNSSKYQVDVDIETLQHKNFNNIFGLGDVAKLPTTKTMLGSIHQANVVRHNILNYLDDKPLNAKYNGQTKGYIYTGLNKMANINHDYNNQGDYSNNLIMGKLNFMYFKSSLSKIYGKLYDKKSNGPAINILGQNKSFD